MIVFHELNLVLYAFDCLRLGAKNIHDFADLSLHFVIMFYPVTGLSSDLTLR